MRTQGKQSLSWCSGQWTGEEKQRSASDQAVQVLTTQYQTSAAAGTTSLTAIELMLDTTGAGKQGQDLLGSFHAKARHFKQTYRPLRLLVGA